MKREDEAFQVKHKAFLLSIMAFTALLAILSLQFSFNLSIDGLNGNQTLEMGRGESQSLNLAISGGMVFKILGATPIGKIYLDTVEVPAGLNASVYPCEGSPFFNSNITIHVDDNATEGIKRIVFRGVGPLGKAKTQEINLKIVVARYFELVGDTTKITMQQNKTGDIPVHIIRDQNYIKLISLKALGLPAGIVPIFDPVSSLPGTALSILRLRINPEARIGTYNFSILGTGEDNKTANCNLSLEIEPEKYFSISAFPPIIKIKVGNESLLSLEIKSVNNYTGKVRLSVLKYPKNIITANIDEPIADLSSSPKDKSNLKLHISDDAIPGKSYYVVVNGLGQDGCSANSSIMVIIEGSMGSFKIKPQFRSLELEPGETNSSKIMIEGINGYEGKITLSVSVVPGITVNINPKILRIDGQKNIASSELRVNAQAEYDSAIKSNMILSGSDMKQNNDECKIAISTRTEPSDNQVILPENQVITPENETPSIVNLSPSAYPIYSDQVEKIKAYPEVLENLYYENTTRDEFFNEIVGKEFNYNKIPIENASIGTRDKWYRNNPSSASYVGEYEIRKELFYSKSDYTIKLVLDNISKPIDVTFMQDSNVVLEVPSGLVEQAMRKLSNL